MPLGSISAASVKLRRGELQGAEESGVHLPRDHQPRHVQFSGRDDGIHQHVRVRVRAGCAWVADGRQDHGGKHAVRCYGGDHVTVSPRVQVDDNVGSLWMTSDE